MDEIYLRDEFIKLGQAIKLAGLVMSGAEAKEVIINGCVKLNGETEVRRGKKVYEGDIIEYDGKKVHVCR